MNIRISKYINTYIYKYIYINICVFNCKMIGSSPSLDCCVPFLITPKNV